MKSKLVTLVCCVLTCATAGIATDADGSLRAAIATRQVTPDPLLPVSGGVGPSRTVSRKEGELTVRALVLEQGGTRVAIVSADFLGFPGPLGNKVRASVKGIPPENILIGATHTHSAPDCYGFPDGKGGTSADPKYLSMVCGRMVEAIEEAAGLLQPAKLKTATGEAKGRIAYNYYAEQLYDPRCHVLQFIAESGRPIATLVNYAIHPEVLGNDAGICSPDLVGPLYDRIAAKSGGTGIFLNSAQGGMVTADNRTGAVPGAPSRAESRTWAECERIGTLLADEALRIVQNAPEVPVSSARLYCTAKQTKLPVDSPLMQQLLRSIPAAAGSEPGFVSTQLNLVNVGDAQIVTVPGEALPNIGYYLKRKMKGKHHLVFGLTNDAFGYILTKEDYDSFARYAYVTKTSLGERTWPTLERDILTMINENPAPTE